MMGLYIAMYAKEGYDSAVTDISDFKIKAGFGGKLGNKGAVILK